MIEVVTGETHTHTQSTYPWPRHNLYQMKKFLLALSSQIPHPLSYFIISTGILAEL